MAGIITNVGAEELLKVLFGATAKQTSFTLKLFRDSVALGEGDTNATHTEVSDGGYSAQTMANDATVAESGGVYTATWGAETFSFTGAITGTSVKGYQVYSGTVLLFEELLPTPYTPTTTGDALVITPKFALGNGTPT